MSGSVVPGPVVLVGMMATGKSTVGRRLAHRLGRRLFDSDAMIEASSGHTVSELWESGGEAAYRELESGALREALDAEPPGVVAAAGGVILAPPNRIALRETSSAGGVVIWLRASPQLLAARVHAGDHRPLLAVDAAGTLRRLDAERGALYAEVADHEIEVDGRTVDDVVGAVLRLVTGSQVAS
ncbi:MAG: shikimate kinase [Acidimicrobiales bacterium]